MKVIFAGIDISGRLEMSVEYLYDSMTEGERQHMVNKLVKHGYQSPKATKAPPEADSTVFLRVVGKQRPGVTAKQMHEKYPESTLEFIRELAKLI